VAVVVIFVPKVSAQEVLILYIVLSNLLSTIPDLTLPFTFSLFSSRLTTPHLSPHITTHNHDIVHIAPALADHRSTSAAAELPLFTTIIFLELSILAIHCIASHLLFVPIGT
jgi:hypothetical protein